MGFEDQTLERKYLSGGAEPRWNGSIFADPRLFILLKNQTSPDRVAALSYMRSFDRVLAFAFDAISLRLGAAPIGAYRELYERSNGNAVFKYRKSQILLEVLAKNLAPSVNEMQPLAWLTIFQFWNSRPPEEIAQNFSEWRGFCRQNGCQHVVYDDETAAEFIAQSFGAEFLHFYRIAHHPAMKADIFRILFAFRNGGCWIDADLQPPENFAAHSLGGLGARLHYFFLRRHAAFTLKRVSNMFFVVPAGSAVLAQIVEELPKTLGSAEQPKILQSTGPGVWTRSFVETILLGDHTELRGSELILPADIRVGPMPWQGGARKEYAYKAVSHWSKSGSAALRHGR